MEDAVILAQHLAESGAVGTAGDSEPDAIGEALAAFDAERQPRAGKLAKMETSNRDAKTRARSPPGCGK